MNRCILGVLSSSPERSFLAREMTYLDGFGQEAQKRETGSIGSEGISGVDLGGLGSESVISENLGFRLNSRVSHFHLNVTFLCKLRRIRDLGCAQDS